MAKNHKDDAEGFLSRWSQRKRTAEQEAEHQPGGETERPGDAAALGAGRKAGRPENSDQDQVQEIDPADLPDIETMGAGDDFSVFMKKGVPEALQRQALRKLWRLNPIFGNLDGLNDYDLDYTDAATVVKNLKSIYQVGKGMVLPEEEEAEKAAEARAAEGKDTEEAAASDEDGAAGAAEALEAEKSETGPAVPAAKTKARNPGDPLVSGVATRRSAAPRSNDRSALRRRWGET